MENEAMETQIPKLIKMGKEMNAFQRKEEHTGLYHAQSPLKGKKKSKKTSLKAQRKDSLPKERKV
jgi:hypothetical protein